MKCRTTFFATLITSLVLSVTAACTVASAATIGLDNSAFVVENSAESSTLSSFTVANNDDRTLVVTVGGERNDSIDTLTFDGTNLTQAAINHTGQTHASVWYLDLADSGAPIMGDITLTWSGSDNGFYLGAFSLFNVQPGGPVAVDDDGNDAGSDVTLSYGVVSDGDMIVESVATQGQSGVGVITPPAGLVTLYNAFESSGGGYGAAAGHEPIIASGSASNTWQFANLAAGPRVRGAGVLFTAVVVPVPEPSTCIVAALGLLGFAFCRWRTIR